MIGNGFDCVLCLFRKQVSVVRSVDCLSACRGKGSTLFPSFKTVRTCLILLLMHLLCALACLYLCILVDENVVIIM